MRPLKITGKLANRLTVLLLLTTGLLANWHTVSHAEWSITIPNPVLEYKYTYDNNGNITNIYDAVAVSSSTFTYDEVDRLTSAVGSYGAQSYSYDSVGNIQGVAEPTKDANGNATSYNGKTIEYDAENRPTKITDTTGTITEFAYDYSGQRIKKIIYNISTPANTQTTFYVGNIYEESYTVASSSPILASTTTVTYVYAGSIRAAGLVSQTTATGTENNTWYYHGDHLGSSSVITDGSGTVIRNISYQPWGNTQENKIPLGIDIDYNPTHKFTGQILDDSTNLYYYGARYYDPALRRFITPDTIVQSPYDPQSLNRYAYVRNNPLIYTDPNGHFAILGFAVVVNPWALAIFAIAYGLDYMAREHGWNVTVDVPPQDVASTNFGNPSTGNQKETPRYHNTYGDGENKTYNTQLPGYTEALMRADYARDKEFSMDGAEVYLSTTKISKSNFNSAMDVYWSTLTSNLAGVPDIPSNPEDAVGVGLQAGSTYYKAKGWAYVASKGLSYQTKSSVFRTYMSKSAMLGKWSGYATAAQFIWAEYDALQAEYNYIQGR